MAGDTGIHSFLFDISMLCMSEIFKAKPRATVGT